MVLWDEAEKITLLGIEMYRYGFFIFLGLLAAAGVMGFLGYAKKCEKGTTPLLLLLSILLGGICSRLLFCLLNQELGFMMPIGSWFNITGGGWSMIGLVGGVMLAGFLAGKITKQNPGVTLDIAACALPAFLALERIGEDCIPDFNYSRALESTFLNGTFLTISDEYGAYYLATRRLAAIVMVILFIALLVDLMHLKRDGNTCLLFLMLMGACSVILESLRYDRFLSITFVGLEQVVSAVFLFIGVTVPAVRVRKRMKTLSWVAPLSVLLAAGIGVGLEFALDRTNVNRILIYIVFVAVMSVPVVLGVKLRSAGGERD